MTIVVGSSLETLSRLNRAHPGKDTSFKKYHATAELAGVTDPNLVFNLRAKLDGAGCYDDFEVDRVVAVELNPSARQSDLVAALEPVQDRLMRRFKAAQQAFRQPSRRGTRPPPPPRRTRRTRSSCSRATWAPTCGPMR